jgi:hypothetical protein
MDRYRYTIIALLLLAGSVFAQEDPPDIPPDGDYTNEPVFVLPSHFYMYVPVINYEEGNPSVSNKIDVFFRKYADTTADLSTKTLMVNTNTALTNFVWTHHTRQLQMYSQSITANDGKAIQTQLGASGVRAGFTWRPQATYAAAGLVPVVSGGITNEP